MGIFGSSLEEKVKTAVDEILALGLGIDQLNATVNGKVVTLTGEAPDMGIKTRVMQEFNSRVECDNVINTIRVAAAPKWGVVETPPTPASAEEDVYVVVPGDTLSAIAKKYYGKASAYMKIFEANRDILKDPNLIKVGQRLRIPK